MEKETDKQTNRQTGQKLHAPIYRYVGIKKKSQCSHLHSFLSLQFTLFSFPFFPLNFPQEYTLGKKCAYYMTLCTKTSQVSFVR